MVYRLKTIKEMLMCCVEGQMSHLEKVDTKELGEVIDMIKDLEEAIYYCTVTEAMKEKSWEYESEDNSEHKRRYMMPEDKWDHDYKYRKYMDSHSPLTFEEWARQEEMEASHSSEAHNGKEGRSHKSRKMYMESKEKHQDKAAQMRELERYMQELTQDVVEMVEDASQEEKQYLSKRVAALANKLSQLND
jgi:hypothetical protein